MSSWSSNYLLLQVFPGLFILGASAGSSTDSYIESLLPAISKSSDIPENLATSGTRAEIIGRAEAERVSKVLVTLGLATFLICFLAAAGKISIPELRGDSIVGCSGWRVLNEKA